MKTTKNAKNTVLIIAGVCLLALALLSAGYAAFSAFRMTPSGRVGPMGAQSGNDSGQIFPPQGEFTPGEGQTPPEGNFTQDDFNGQRSDSGSFPGGMSGRRGFGVSRWLSLGAYVLALLGAVAAAIGIFKAKKWGAILGIIIAAALLISGVFGLFRTFGWLNLVIPIVKILLAAAVIVLLVLPAARAAYATHKADAELDDDDDDEDEDDVKPGAAVKVDVAISNPVELEAGDEEVELEVIPPADPSATNPGEEAQAD